MDKALYEFFQSKKMDPENLAEVQQWIVNASNLSIGLNFATHNGKYSHSGVKKEMCCVAIERDYRADGYVRTGNCEPMHIDTLLGMDCVGNAAALGAYGFLSVQLSNGKTVLELLQHKSEVLRNELKLDIEHYINICESFLKIFPEDNSYETSHLLKQVYFPVAEDEYHLLSLVSPSILMVELKKRILERYQNFKEIKAAKEAERKGLHHAGYCELLGLTEMAFGGTKAQNIGVLNLSARGSIWHLDSVPPSLDKQRVRLPKHDFFTECLWKKKFEDRFERIAKLESLSISNIRTKQSREVLLQSIADSIIEAVWSIRGAEVGWSSRDTYQHLPEYQKIWLDNANTDKRKSSTSWSAEVVNTMTRWICRYEVGYKNVNRPLATDSDFIDVKHIIEQTREAWV